MRVPAKVNLHLGVGPLRTDGYHEVATVFCAVSLYDDIVAESSETLRLTVDGEGAHLPTDQGNLAYRAASLLASETGVKPEVSLHIHKQIPVAAGLAGGSADAAGTLLACNELWKTGLTVDELAGLASTLGSDVAFPLYGGVALGAGRGEILTPVAADVDLRLVLAISHQGLSTPAVYAELDRLRGDAATTESASDPEGIVAALRRGDVGAVAELLCNDMQSASLSLRHTLANVLELGGGASGLVSGSGPTIFFLARSADEEHHLVAALAPHCRRTLVVTAPVPGAQLSYTP